MTRDDAIKTMLALRENFAENPVSWENPTLDMYLDAMASWLSTNTECDEPPSWELFCLMLEAAKIYE